ncbi:formin-like protein 20 [Cucumis melo var. makuwa]|uniref:Formin-like protein 20 n=1 Tax=Cucumis melo var. makuwa TaxID=1194695 RepID=A0A5D3D9I0_CUCMM|nr:formin-like protein 20 [Cucumis melo var. makuwa]
MDELREDPNGKSDGCLRSQALDRCYNLEDTEPFATEYSCVLIYGGSMRRTRPCFGKGIHPVFEEKFVFEFTEKDVELNIWVLANKPTRNDEVIGSLRIQLQQLLSDGHVDSTWTLQKTDDRPAGYLRLTMQIPTSSCRLERQDSYYTAPRLDSTAPPEAEGTQRPILHQLLPYGGRPPPSPTQPNESAAALWSQFLPYGSPPPTASAYNPTTAPPAGYPIHPPPPPGSISPGIYPPPPR